MLDYRRSLFNPYNSCYLPWWRVVGHNIDRYINSNVYSVSVLQTQTTYMQCCVPEWLVYACVIQQTEFRECHRFYVCQAWAYFVLIVLCFMPWENDCIMLSQLCHYALCPLKSSWSCIHASTIVVYQWLFVVVLNWITLFKIIRFSLQWKLSQIMLRLQVKNSWIMISCYCVRL